MSQKFFTKLALVLCLILSATVVLYRSASAQETQDEKDIRVEEVLGARRKVNNPRPAPKKKVYHPDDSNFPVGTPPQGMEYVQIGVTVWRARPVTARDDDEVAKEIVDGKEMASERIGDYITNGERIYLGIESLAGDFLQDKSGYLYVINREQYADGMFGRARLIFPTLLTYGGKNRIRPGLPIVLPRTKGEPFVVKRSTSAQVAETFTIILSPWQLQLPEPLSNKAMVLPPELVADWEKQYGGRMYQASLRGGTGQARTKLEQVVGNREIIDGAEALTQDDPSPQTVFRGAVKIGNPAMVTVTLRFKTKARFSKS